MQLTLLKGKIHRATVTQADLDYEGSVSIDRELLEASHILPYEQVDIYNITNGERFTTYAIEAPAGSREICINGAAAHKAEPGDLVIICAYVTMDEMRARRYVPHVVLVDKGNNIVVKDHTESYNTKH